MRQLELAINCLVGHGGAFRGERNILVVTGDLVDSPTGANFNKAKDLLRRLENAVQFHSVFVVPGNHDLKYAGNIPRWVNPFSWLGWTAEFHSAFANRRGVLPQNRVHSVSAPGGESVEIFGYDSNNARFARGKVSDLDILGATGDALAIARREPPTGALRIGALHHHPLPLVDGERDRILGIEAEGLAYMERPATFLDHCRSLGIRLVLHGHRHGGGIRSFSVPDQRSGGVHEVVAVACPSSTGCGPYPGLNLVCLPADAPVAEIYQVNPAGLVSGGDMREAVGVPSYVLPLDPGRSTHQPSGGSRTLLRHHQRQAVHGLLTAIGQGLWSLRSNSHPRICILRHRKDGWLEVDGSTAFNFADEDPDKNLLLRPNVGVSALALSHKRAVYGMPRSGNLSPAELAQVREDRQCILSVPILRTDGENEGAPLGVLSIDSNLTREAMGWDNRTETYLARFVPTLGVLLPEW